MSPRTVVGGWSRYPTERATAAGQLAGTVFGIGIGLLLAGGNPYIVAALLQGGVVLILTAWKAAESHRGAHDEQRTQTSEQTARSTDA